MKKLIVSLVLLQAASAFAVKEYYGISRSIRALGMGGAFYGLSNNEYALFYNPAGLSLYTGESEGMLRINAQLAGKTIPAIKTLKDLLDQDSQIGTVVDALKQYQGDPLYANVGLLPYWFRKNFAVGLFIADTKVDFAVLGKELDTSVDLTAISDSGLIIGYAQSVPGLRELHVGANLKGILRAGGRRVFSVLEIAQNNNIKIDPESLGGAGVGIDADLGAIYEISGIPWGIANRASLTITNLAASTFHMSQKGNPPDLVRQLSLGYYTAFEGWGPFDNFHVLFDLSEFHLGGESDPHYGARVGSFFKHVNFGVEAPMKRLAFRLGFHQGYLTAGLGLNLNFFKLDFATYAEELAQTGPGRLGNRRYALSIAFGAGSPPTPVMSATKLTAIDANDSKPQDKIPETEEKPKTEPKIDPKLQLPEQPKAPTTEGKAP